MKNSLRFATVLIAAQISVSPLNIYAAIEDYLDDKGGWTGWTLDNNEGWDDLAADQAKPDPNDRLIKALKFDDNTGLNATLPAGYDGIIIPGVINNSSSGDAKLNIHSGTLDVPVQMGPHSGDIITEIYKPIKLLNISRHADIGENFNTLIVNNGNLVSDVKNVDILKIISHTNDINYNIECNRLDTHDHITMKHIDNVIKGSSLLTNSTVAISHILPLHLSLHNKYYNKIQGSFATYDSLQQYTNHQLLFVIDENSYLINSRLENKSLSDLKSAKVKKTLIIENDGKNSVDAYAGIMEFDFTPYTSSSSYDYFEDISYLPSLFDYKTQLVDEYNNLTDNQYDKYDQIISNLSSFIYNISNRSDSISNLSSELLYALPTESRTKDEIKDEIKNIINSIDSVFTNSMSYLKYPSILVSRNTSTSFTDNIPGIGETERQRPVKISTNIGTKELHFANVKLEGDHELSNHIYARRIEFDNSKFNIHHDIILDNDGQKTMDPANKTVINNSIIDIKNSHNIHIYGPLTLEGKPCILMNANRGNVSAITLTKPLKTENLDSFNLYLNLNEDDILTLNKSTTVLFTKLNTSVNLTDLKTKLNAQLLHNGNAYNVTNLFDDNFVLENDSYNATEIEKSSDEANLKALNIVNDDNYGLIDGNTLNSRFFTQLLVDRSIVMENDTDIDINQHTIIPRENATSYTDAIVNIDELAYLNRKILNVRNDEILSDQDKNTNYNNYLTPIQSLISKGLDNTTSENIIELFNETIYDINDIMILIQANTTDNLADVIENLSNKIKTIINEIQIDDHYSFISKNIAAASESNIALNGTDVEINGVNVPLQNSKVTLSNAIGSDDLKFSRVKLEGDHELKNSIHAHRIELDNSKFDINPDEGTDVLFDATETIIDNSIIDIKTDKQLSISGNLILKNNPYIFIDADSDIPGILFNDGATINTADLNTLNILLNKTNLVLGDTINIFERNQVNLDELMDKLRVTLYHNGSFKDVSSLFSKSLNITLTAENIAYINAENEKNTEEENAAILEENLSDLINGNGSNGSGSKNSAVSKENIKILAGVTSLMNNLKKLPKEKQAQAVERLMTPSENSLGSIGSNSMNQISSNLSVPISVNVSSGDNPALKAKSFWAKPFYSTSKQDISDGVGYEMSSLGSSVGFDTKINNNTVLGVAATLLKSNLDFTGIKEGDTSKVNMYIGSVYGALTFNNNLFAQGVVSAGKNKTTTKSARIDVSDNAIEESNYDAKILSTQVGLGANMIREKSIITPLFEMNFTHTDTPKYVSKIIAPGDNSDLNMISERRKVNQLYGSASLKFASRGIAMSNHLNFMPDFKIKLTKNFAEKSDDIKRRLEGAKENFAMPSGKEDKNITYNLGFGGHVDDGYKAQYGVEYNLIGSKGFTSHQVALSIKMIF